MPTETKLQEQDDAAYLSLRDSTSLAVTVADFRAAVEARSGLDPRNDARLSGLADQLRGRSDSSEVSRGDFEGLMRAGGRLVERALRGELVIPEFYRLRDEVERIFTEVADRDPVGEPPAPPIAAPKLGVFDREYPAAKNADYIPSLHSAPDGWGIAICTVDGQRLAFGDHDRLFSIQSCCKPINYCQALETFNQATRGDPVGEGGEETAAEKVDRRSRREDARKRAEFEVVAQTELALGVHDFIDCEPSGAAFNAFSFNRHGMPSNPLINAGAIMCSALVSRGRAVDIAMPEIQEVWRRLAGKEGRPSYDPETANGEKRTGSNNRSIAYKMEGLEAFPFAIDSGEKVERILDFYFNSCSITMTASDMAVVAATLANRGVCPTTGDRVFHAATVTNCLAAMLHCGMYDSAGRFGRLVGLPAKSGVGGGIFVVVPGVMGICTYSPRLDRIGNSLRGLRFYERLLDQYALHMLELPRVTGDHKLDVRMSHLRSKHQASQEVISAASRGDVEAIMRFEHDAGSPIAYLQLLGSADYDGRTPLHLAASEGSARLVQYLLNAGVPAQPVDRWGQTPLADAERAGHSDVAHSLVRAISDRDEQVVACLTDAWDGRLAEEVRNGALRENAPIRATTPDQLELIWAAAEGDLPTLRRHVARGQELHARDYDDRTPLHLATAQGQTEAVKFIVTQLAERPGGLGLVLTDHERASRLSWPDRWGRTPLDEAADPHVFDADGTPSKHLPDALAQCAEVLRGAGATSGEALLSAAGTWRPADESRGPADAS